MPVGSGTGAAGDAEDDGTARRSVGEGDGEATTETATTRRTATTTESGDADGSEAVGAGRARPGAGAATAATAAAPPRTPTRLTMIAARPLRRPRRVVTGPILRPPLPRCTPSRGPQVR